MSSYGYVRVSSKDQNETRQLLAMRDAGIEKSHIYIDKQSGKDFNRPGYIRMLSRLHENDVVYIKSIDRLGRDYREIQNEWRRLVNEKKVDIVVMDMPLLDTRKGKDLMGTFLSDIVLQVLSFVAENERSNIRQRQAEGIRAARMKGVHMGRPQKPLNDKFYQSVFLWKKGRLSCAEAARQCGFAETTFRRKAKMVVLQELIFIFTLIEIKIHLLDKIPELLLNLHFK